MGYQPGLFGYSFLFGCTLLAMSNLERFLKFAVDPMVERRVSGAAERRPPARPLFRCETTPSSPNATQMQSAKERHDGVLKAKELAAKSAH